MSGQPDDYRLKPFQIDVSLLRLAHEKSAGRRALTLSAVTAIGLLVLTAGIEGDLIYRPWPNIVWDDVLRFFGRYSGEEEPDTDFPMMRDSISMAILGCQLANAVVLYRQWESFTDLFPDLVSSGAIKFLDERRARTIIEHANTNYTSLGRFSLPTIALCIVLTIFSYRGLPTDRAFAPFGPEDPLLRSEWSKMAYDNWWAGSGHFGAYLWQGLLGIFVYFTILQNIVGLSVCRVIYRLRRIWQFDFDPLNADGAFGWKPVDRTLRTVYISLSLNLTTLTIAIVALQGYSFGHLSLLAVIWAGAACVYVFIPLQSLRIGMSAMKKRKIADERIALAQIPDEEIAKATMDAGERIDRIHSVPVVPLGMPTVRVICLALIPACVAVIQLLAWAFS